MYLEKPQIKLLGIENKHKQTCHCGKKYNAWDNLYSVSSYKKDGKIIKEKEMKINVGYPENACHCKCGTKWKGHYPDSLNPEIYKNYVRENCVICYDFLPGTLEYYEKQGNFCGDCNRQAHINELKRVEALKLAIKKKEADRMESDKKKTEELKTEKIA